ncbi:MAG: dGTP triphosphohydrolase [Methylophilaceae bacterium]
MTLSNPTWDTLLNSERRKPSKSPKSGEDTRTEIERDYDRILFSTPVRRLADKTQVFPLDKNDSVRTRLTHSHEVSNLARSIGTALVFHDEIAKSTAESNRNIPAILAAIGLAHDLGNPPFGHQGESAIQSWFVDNRKKVLEPLEQNTQWVQDFIKFEGNAQGFRLLTRLQLLNDDFGLDLTYSTLAALMKYPTSSNLIDKKVVAKKKHGFFASEEKIATEVLERTGLSLGKRHPLAYIMEACDDIAYVVLDIEDAVKKGLASFSDLMSYLKHNSDGDRLIDYIVSESEEKNNKYRRDKGIELSPAELNDISMQRFRVFAIGELIKTARITFVENKSIFINGDSEKSLLEISEGENLRKHLKEFARKNAYTHKEVLRVELQGYNVIRGLMDIFWAAIVDREKEKEVGSSRNNPFTRFVYSRISENYRRVFEHPSEDMKDIPIRYRECQLLTDMISGMTDSYAVELFADLSSIKGAYDPMSNLRNDKTS